MNVNEFDEIAAQTFREALQRQLSEALRDYRCPTHGEPVRGVSVVGGRFSAQEGELSDAKVTIQTCCDRAETEATELAADSP